MNIKKNIYIPVDSVKVINESKLIEVPNKALYEAIQNKISKDLGVSLINLLLEDQSSRDYVIRKVLSFSQSETSNNTLRLLLKATRAAWDKYSREF